jgi:hypothetical protein
MGFLIRDDLHKSYDRYEWGWYWKVRKLVDCFREVKTHASCRQNEKFYAHFFALEDPSMRSMHGKVIDPPVEMRVQPREYLDQRLTAWHYRQCVLARIRGFADGFETALQER